MGPRALSGAVARRARAFGRRADLALARLPLLAVKERVYDRRYYCDAEHDAMYERLAAGICELLRPTTAVDVGCGTGLLLGKLARRGVEVTGVEGSRHAIAISHVPGHVVRWNLERGVPQLGRFDVCLCIEVAEHLPRRSAAGLVADLVGLSDLVIFTAATPGQGGTLHVNEQPHEYWVDLFRAHGYEPAGVTEAALKAEIAGVPEPSWMHANLMVFGGARPDARL